MKGSKLVIKILYGLDISRERRMEKGEGGRDRGERERRVGSRAKHRGGGE